MLGDDFGAPEIGQAAAEPIMILRVGLGFIFKEACNPSKKSGPQAAWFCVKLCSRGAQLLELLDVFRGRFTAESNFLVHLLALGIEH